MWLPKGIRPRFALNLDALRTKLREQMRTQWAGGMDGEIRDTHTRQGRF
jgi:hypothetical protein